MSKTVLFKVIQFSISTQFISIWPIDRTLSGASTPGQSGPGSDGHKEVLRIPHISSITGASPSNCLVSYPRQIWRCERIKRNIKRTYQKKILRCVLTCRKLTGVSIFCTKGSILKKISVSFIVRFCLGKYSFSLYTFWTHLIFWRKSVFHSLFISVLVNTASVLILFEHTLYFEENQCFIHCLFLSW